MPKATQEQTVLYIFSVSSIFNTLMKNLSMISNSQNIYHLTNMSSKLKQLWNCWQSTNHVPCITQGCTNFPKSRGHLKFQVPEGWQEGSSILKTHKYYAPSYKSHLCDLALIGTCAPLAQSTTFNTMLTIQRIPTSRNITRRFKSDLEFYIFL